MPFRLSLVALVAAALAGAALKPLHGAAMDRYELRRASDDVRDAMGEARLLAVRRGTEVRVVIDFANLSLAVEGGRWRRLPNGIGLAGPAATRSGETEILFRPDGSSTGGQVVVSVRGRAVSLLVDAGSGGVRRYQAEVR
ncbi:GspH/FimT family pseudopilin [Magnetospirillum sp. UT-4]|uniref:GspH/FimT family pseudopilin n=1 Tax=Magnetospirillum sp. UT-4 TaxID=2681467 RepID=UPI001384A221|nr:GspH/FimT family pseudopilin [Magnetospirillum sp. UT-4]CAA7625165.1 exported hypothetical protein [Magnetospirillum sp. UT-4]